MKIIHYSIKISDSIMSALHNQYYNIDEFHVPELGISLNKTAAFITKEDRYEKATVIKELELKDPELMDLLVSLQDSLREYQSNYPDALDKVSRLFISSDAVV